MVLATQNPVEQEGTYPLPEAQVDRFMLKLRVGYPTREEEKIILERMSRAQQPQITAKINTDTILSARAAADGIYIDDKVKNYIVDIVFATRSPKDFKLDDVASYILYGASPRASIYLTQAAKALAFLDGRGYVTPEDVKELGPDVLRHRLILSYEAEAENITPEDIIKKIFATVEVP
jgi:MoxR-like ATPase